MNLGDNPAAWYGGITLLDLRKLMSNPIDVIGNLLKKSGGNILMQEKHCTLFLNVFLTVFVICFVESWHRSLCPCLW